MPIIKTNHIELYYDTFGEAYHPPLLLIMGACTQSINWPDVFCEKLAAQGFYVIRYDHRDTGQSSYIIFEMNPYTIDDMMQDAIDLMNSLQLKRFHVMGLSLGGPIAEWLSVKYPDRIQSITLIATSCDFNTMNRSFAGLPHLAGALSPVKAIYLEWMQSFSNQPTLTFDELVDFRVKGWHILNGFKAPFDVHLNRSLQIKYLQRARHPASHLNHLKVCISAEPIISWLPSQIKHPALVIHGTEDPIFPIDHGRKLSELISGSVYVELDGFGHVPNSIYDDTIIQSFLTLTQRST